MSCVQNINPLADLCVPGCLSFFPGTAGDTPLTPGWRCRRAQALPPSLHVAKRVYHMCPTIVHTSLSLVPLLGGVLCVLLVSALASIVFRFRLELLNDRNSKVDPSPACAACRRFPLEITIVSHQSGQEIHTHAPTSPPPPQSLSGTRGRQA